MLAAMQIEALRAEAAAAGDQTQVYLCDRALSGDAIAGAKCAEVMREKRDADAANEEVES